MAELGIWWNAYAAPPLRGWRRHRSSLAGAMEGSSFITVDGAFHRMADLERWRQAGLEASDMADDARTAAQQMVEAAGLLMLEGFSHGELEAVRKELDALADDPWLQNDEAD